MWKLIDIIWVALQNLVEAFGIFAGTGKKWAVHLDGVSDAQIEENTFSSIKRANKRREKLGLTLLEYPNATAKKE